MTGGSLRIEVVLAVVLAGGCGTPTGPSTSVAQLSVTPSSVVAGAVSEATVTLDGRAPDSGVQVTLASSDGAALVPSSVLVNAGMTSAMFAVQTKVVAADTTATITATGGTATRAVALRILSPLARPSTLDALLIDPTALRGGQSARGTVRLTSTGASALTVNLKSSNSVATVPPSIVIPPGALSATFDVTTRSVELETRLEISASAGDISRTVPLRITP